MSKHIHIEISKEDYIALRNIAESKDYRSPTAYLIDLIQSKIKANSKKTG